MTYQWMIVQDGRLPLSPDGRVTLDEHVCTSTVVWPTNAELSPQNSVIVDPCLSRLGIKDATSRLKEQGSSLNSIGSYFETHSHHDHLLRVPRSGPLSGLRRNTTPKWVRLAPAASSPLCGIQSVDCPGHSPDLKALRFRADDGDIWIVSDAILNREWLVAWDYYWPNFYEPNEIIQTWRTVTNILQFADLVIPGHGLPIAVTKDLIEELVDSFPRAEHYRQCPDVVCALEHRLEKCRGNRRHSG
jgi:glyoxylase-like metal-dependent hydrolase (beta-lactamase superfamily II)